MSTPTPMEPQPPSPPLRPPAPPPGPRLPPDHPTRSENRIEATFHFALSRPPGDREAYLAEACAGEEELLREVRAVLKAHEEAGDFLITEEPSPVIKAALARLKPEEAGERIGPYKLLQQIGEGGFGTVWMAEQEHPVRRRVALKIIKLGMDTKEVVARFEQERQALAMMDHPNIAKVFDAGATPTGRPFFVMELVRGISITKYCDQANLPTAERLHLFIAVCHAVQHAHQKGIIHRDLKPSNILVTLHDGVPVPKVIDFGVAKATQQRLTDLTVFTQFEQMIGTPLYMSPEQAEMSGLDIDTRTDIYALGVLLYELLTGRTPFDPKDLVKRGLDEIRRAIREQEPPRPSTALITMATDAMTAVAQHRQSDSAKLIGLVRGDLDWIVMKAIEKSRTRRYDTANAFAEDIQRHLTNEPVVACPPSTAYRLQKLVRRNKLAFAATCAVALALITGIAASTWQAVRATRAEQTTGEERDRARKAEQLAKDQRQLAETARGQAEHNFYTASMNLAQGAWEAANISRLRGLLEETRTYPNRGFEWYYWQRQTHLELRTLRGHEDMVTSGAFSPDGRRIVTGSGDKTAKVWDADNGRELLTLKGHTEIVTSVAFSPDGRRIVTGSLDETAKVWDAENGRELLVLKGHKGEGISGEILIPAGRWRWIIVGAHTGAVMSVAFSPDGRRILTGSWDRTAKLWDTENGRELLTLKGHTNTVRAVAFAPDGRRILTGSFDKTAKLWDAETGRELLTLKGHTEFVNSVAFAPDARSIVTGSLDETAKVWDAENGRELLSLKGHSSHVISVAISPDCRRILTGSEDNTAKVWDAENGRELLTLKGHSDEVNWVAFSPDGRRILTGSDDETAKVWDADNSRQSSTLKGHTDLVFSVAYSPDGRRIATSSIDKTAKLWDADNGRELLTFKTHAVRGSVAFSPDGRRILTSGEDKTAKLWDAETGRELLTFKGHSGVVVWDAFSSDGRRILTASRDKSAKLWAADTGRELLTLKGHADMVTSVASSPDGRRIVTGSVDKTAKMWDADNGRELLTLKGHNAEVVSVAFPPDGRRIVTGSTDKTAKVWNAETGRELLTLIGHDSVVTSVAFSPDGRRIVTGSWDKTAKLWDAESGRELLTLEGHNDIIWSVAFSPNGRRIVTGGGDGTTKVWLAATPEEVEAWRKEEQPAAK